MSTTTYVRIKSRAFILGLVILVVIASFFLIYPNFITQIMPTTATPTSTTTSMPRTQQTSIEIYEISPSQPIIGNMMAVRGDISPTVGAGIVTLTYTRPDGIGYTRYARVSTSSSFTDIFYPDVIGIWNVIASYLNFKSQPYSFRVASPQITIVTTTTSQTTAITTASQITTTSQIIATTTTSSSTTVASTVTTSQQVYSKILSIPFCSYSPTEAVCSVRVMWMILQYYGYDVSIQQIMQDIVGKTYEQYMAEFGLNVTTLNAWNVYPISPSDEVRMANVKNFLVEQINLGRPVQVDWANPTHSVLVVGYKNYGNTIVFHDGNGLSPYLELPLDNFVVTRILLNCRSVYKT